ncbi:hypothetical protein OAM67_00165 [bacterium]|nr:hypothetical protein [bacterium]
MDHYHQKECNAQGYYAACSVLGAVDADDAHDNTREISRFCGRQGFRWTMERCVADGQIGVSEIGPSTRADASDFVNWHSGEVKNIMKLQELGARIADRMQKFGAMDAAPAADAADEAPKKKHKAHKKDKKDKKADAEDDEAPKKKDKKSDKKKSKKSKKSDKKKDKKSDKAGKKSDKKKDKKSDKKKDKKSDKAAKKSDKAGKKSDKAGKKSDKAGEKKSKKAGKPKKQANLLVSEFAATSLAPAVSVVDFTKF